MKVIYADGQRIEVGVSGRFENTPRVVRIDMPEGVDMTPDTARSVAIALIEHAAYAERRNEQQKGAS